MDFFFLLMCVVYLARFLESGAISSVRILPKISCLCHLDLAWWDLTDE
jgi:hypothetical protein